MSTIDNIDKLVSVQSLNGKSIACTTSRQVAETFGKRHDHILRDIKALIESGEVSRLNFEPSDYTDSRGKSQPMYLLDEKFTTLLIMGFTGSEALEFKSQYVDQFIAMRTKLSRLPKNTNQPVWLETRIESKDTRVELTEQLSRFVVYAVEQGSNGYKKFPQGAYISMSNSINDALFPNIELPKHARDKMTKAALNTIQVLERALTKKLSDSMSAMKSYKDILDDCKKTCEVYGNLMASVIENPFKENVRKLKA